VVKATNILTLLALGALPLALTVGCDLLQKQQSKEEIIAEFEAKAAEEARLAKMEADYAAQQEQIAANDAASKQALEDQRAAFEKEIAAQKARTAQAVKAAEEAKAQPRRGRNDAGAAGAAGQQTARMSVVNIPQGTQVAVSLSGPVSTDTHKVGDQWEGTLAQSVVVDGATIWGAGTRALGTVSASTPTGRLANGQGTLAIKLTEVGGAGIDGGIFAVTGDAKGARNAKTIGTTAALGALAGYLSDKNNKTDHALVGAAAGAAVGTALAAGTASTVITMPTTAITFTLPSAERVTVRNR
jgi:hypothetical protein